MYGQVGLNPRQDFITIKGFRDIVYTAGLESLYFAGGFRQPADKNDRNLTADPIRLDLSTDLVPLSQLSELRWLFVENVAAPVDLSFVDGLGELREFGISASRGKKLSVKSLVPLASLKRLEMLWLVSIRMEEGGLKPLERLDRLESFRSTVRKNSREFKDLCAALPSLKYFQPVG